MVDISWEGVDWHGGCRGILSNGDPKGPVGIVPMVGSYTADLKSPPGRAMKGVVMKLMEIGTKYGLAGRFQFESIDDVLRHTPHTSIWTWSGGRNEDGLFVTAHLNDGKAVDLKTEIDHGDAMNTIPDYHEDAPTIGEQIADLDVVALSFRWVNVNQNEDEEWEEYLPIVPPDWGKLRRRVEDALRKTSDKSVLFSFANKLNVKIY
jgi:hypothetical protein